MRKFLILILVLVFHLAGAQAPDPDFTDKIAANEARWTAKSAAFVESDDYAATDVIYQKLDFSLDPAVNYISGSVYSLLKIKDDLVSQIRFDLTDPLTVDSVWYNGSDVAFQHADSKIVVAVPEQVNSGQVVSVTVFYHGAPPQTGFGSFIIAKHSNVPVMWTLSEPYGASDWWPCKQSLADKIDSIDVFVTCPQEYKAASNGKLISDEITGTRRTAHWKHRYPIATYLIGIAVTNYESYSDFLELADKRKIEVLNYVYPEYLQQAKTSGENILNILSLYNSKFITYPFASEKYGHAQFGWGGGMEHQTMSFVYSLDFELVAHEMAHQWFGDYITLASWHDIWLNEGFATYLAGLCYENLLDGYYWPIWKKYEVNKITASPAGSVYVKDTTNVNRIFDSRLSYAKGAYLLHMLRWEMGDTKFFAGLNQYLLDPEIANGFAAQAKLVSHLEAAADTSLTGFFDDWYYGEGYPVYHLNYYNDYGDYGKSKLKISQSPSDPSVSFFKMHVPVRIWKNGKSTDLRLYNTSQDQEFILSQEPVDSIQFDPDKWLIAKVDIVNAAESLSENSQIQIFPENLSGRIRIVLPGGFAKGTVRVLTIRGETVFEANLSGTDSRMGLDSLKNGIYLVQVKSGNQEKTRKIVVCR